ncbi:MAG: hypothetical protein O7F70_02465, partial [Gemmatimonadetes bacterium]|nr:hypothetical protein [Gemmatimonadota bacterium]
NNSHTRTRPTRKTPITNGPPTLIKSMGHPLTIASTLGFLDGEEFLLAQVTLLSLQLFVSPQN